MSGERTLPACWLESPAAPFTNVTAAFCRNQLFRSAGEIPQCLRERLSQYTTGMLVNSLITVDPEILGGTPVFKGTRVPVKTLFEYLEDNYSLDEFIECFPTVSREMVRRVLEQSKDALLQPA